MSLRVNKAAFIVADLAEATASALDPHNVPHELPRLLIAAKEGTLALCSREGTLRFVSHLEVIIEILTTGTLRGLWYELVLFTFILIVLLFTPQCKVLRVNGRFVTPIIAHLRAARRILSLLLLSSYVVEHLSKHLIDLCRLALNLLLPVGVLLQLVDYK